MLDRIFCTGNDVQVNIAQKILHRKYCRGELCCTGNYCTRNNVQGIDTGKCCTEDVVHKLLKREMLYRRCCTGNSEKEFVVRELLCIGK